MTSRRTTWRARLLACPRGSVPLLGILLASVLLAGCAAVDETARAWSAPINARVQARMYAPPTNLVIFDSVQVGELPANAPFYVESVTLADRVFSLNLVATSSVSYLSDSYVFAKSANNAYSFILGEACWPNITFDHMLCNTPATFLHMEDPKRITLDIVGVTHHALDDPDELETLDMTFPIGWADATQGNPLEHIQYVNIPLRVSIHQAGTHTADSI